MPAAEDTTYKSTGRRAPLTRARSPRTRAVAEFELGQPSLNLNFTFSPSLSLSSALCRVGTFLGQSAVGARPICAPHPHRARHASARCRAHAGRSCAPFKKLQVTSGLELRGCLRNKDTTLPAVISYSKVPSVTIMHILYVLY